MAQLAEDRLSASFIADGIHIRRTLWACCCAPRV